MYQNQFYTDDGWSGANFDRPAFKRMMEDIAAGNIDCVIVKDLSRLGRDYIEAGRLIQKIFPAYGIRFIALTDHYDSLTADFNETTLVLPVKNFVNDAYCRDISGKVKSHQKVKREKGQFIGAFAAYGYCRDPQDKNKLVIDPYAAENVRRIFRMKIEGYSLGTIADRLNESGILSPMEYKRSKGEKFRTGFVTGGRAKWSAVAVRRILANEVYTGTMVQGKAERINYKVKKSVAKPESEWVKVADTHEAVISREDFQTVQELLMVDARAGSSGKLPHMYTGLLYCADCGAPMFRTTSRYKGREKAYFVCSTKHRGQGCSRHGIPEEDLGILVKQALTDRITAFTEDVETVREMGGMEMEIESIFRFDREIAALREERDRYLKLRAGLYKDYRNGVISGEDLKAFGAVYDEKCSDTEDAIAKQEKTVRELLRNGVEAGLQLEKYKAAVQVETLDRNTLVHLIKRIEVGEGKRVHVVMKNQDQFDKLAMLSNFADKEAG